MLVNRLKYLIENNIVDHDKIMLKYNHTEVSYKIFLQMLEAIDLDSNFNLQNSNDKYTHVYYKTKNPLISLIMFYYYTSKGKICIMLPQDIEDTNEILNTGYVINIKENDAWLESLIVRSDRDSLNYNRQSYFSKLKNDVEDLFLQAYSSGTSGMRKSVERTYKSWFCAFDIQNEVFEISRDTIAYIQGDINYTANLNYALAVTYAGGSLIISSKKGPRELIELIKEKNINNAFLVPTVLGILSRYMDKKNINYKLKEKSLTIVTAGEKLQEQVYKKLKLRLSSINVIEYYGASELGHISYSKNDEILIGNGYVGSLFKNVKVKIIDGKIYTDSPYHAKEHQGFVSAGDFGEFIDGKLYVHGRGSSIISRSAMMINTEEMRRNISRKLDCESYACTYKDLRRGQNYIMILKTDLSKNYVDVELANLFNKSNKPDQIIIVNKIKTKASGKIDYNFYLELCNK